MHICIVYRSGNEPMSRDRLLARYYSYSDSVAIVVYSTGIDNIMQGGWMHDGGRLTL